MGKTSKEYQAERKAKGLCGSCGNKVVPGKSRCQRCIDKAKDRYRKKQGRPRKPPTDKKEKAKHDWYRERYEARKAAGLCVNCGEPKSDESVYCQTCLDRQRKRQRRRAANLSKDQTKQEAEQVAQRQQEGRCLDCGADERFSDERCRRCWALWQEREHGLSRHDARKAAKLCQKCPEVVDTDGVNCSACEDRRRQQREAYRREGKCTGCGRPTTGSSKCEKCKQYHRDLTAKRREQRICVKCGKMPPEAGKTTCKACTKDNRKRDRKKRVKLKDEVMAAYGGPICAGCGEDEVEILEIDHINGGGNAHRKSLVGPGGKVTNMTSAQFYRWLRDQGYPPGFRVLCPTCNKKAHKQIPLPSEGT